MRIGSWQGARSTHHRRDAGFTLLEVLVGIVIVAVALAGLYALYDAIVRIEAHRRQLTEATAALTSTAEQLKALPWEQLTSKFPDNTCLKGAVTVGNITVQCTVQLKDSGLVHVTVTASAGGKKVADISFLRAKEGF